MQEDIIYNQIISFEKNLPINCHQIKKSFIENGKLILYLDDLKKITISGKRIDASGNIDRIHELVSMAEEKGFDIREKSVKHYAKDSGGVEYVLVRW
ncbi:hypothetical protein ACFL2X_04835 [Candidatus Latescibacterota bacterium]